MAKTGEVTGGELLIHCLLAHGADLAFCVPGESYLGALDAMKDVQDRLRLIVCRHEAAAGNMAEAYGKLTGRPGICFVTRGPGATHAAISVHIARQDSTPMILFVGQIEREHRDREAFQEVDFRAMYAPLAKWAVEIDDVRRIPEYISRAYHIAVNGRPGPVVLALPEDVLTELTAPIAVKPFAATEAAPQAADMAQLAAMIAKADKPLLVLGGSGWSQDALRDIRAFAEHCNLPTLVTFRRQDLFDNTHRLYGGVLGLGTSPALTKRVQESDMLIVVGDRLSEAATGGYTLIDIPVPKQTMVHVHPSPDEIGRVYRPNLAITSGAGAFAAAAAALLPRKGNAEWAKAIRADYLATIALPVRDQALDVAKIIDSLNTLLPEGAILTNGAGAYAAYVHRYFHYRSYPTQLAPACGAMGYGLPAAIAAKLKHPDRPVLCFAGDGCFLMSGQELATAVRYKLPVVIIIINNESYGSIRMHQDRRYPGRSFATDLNNPDFVAFARSFGAHGERIETTAAFAPALAAALKADRPTVLEIKLDIDTMLAQSPRRQ